MHNSSLDIAFENTNISSKGLAKCTGCTDFFNSIEVKWKHNLPVLLLRLYCFSITFPVPHFTIHPSQCSAVGEKVLSVQNNSRAQSGWLPIQLWGIALDLSRKQHICHVLRLGKQKINTGFDNTTDCRSLDTKAACCHCPLRRKDSFINCRKS